MNAPRDLPLSEKPSDRAARQAAVVAALAPLLPAHALLWHGEDTVPYECDGLTAYRQQPLVVALPETEAQVAAVLRECHRLNVPVVSRGAEGVPAPHEEEKDKHPRNDNTSGQPEPRQDRNYSQEGPQLVLASLTDKPPVVILAPHRRIS